MKKLETTEGRSVILCCGQKGCPQLKLIGNDGVRVTFDDGTGQDMLIDELRMIPDALDWLLSPDSEKSSLEGQDPSEI